ncbi:MAG: RusA family crossover junction endodeoxyribonuclease [Chloroflexia bacterium]
MNRAKPEGHNTPAPAPVPPPALRAILPLPPGVNNLYVSVNGRRVLSQEGKRFKAGVRSRLDDMRASGLLTPETLDALRSGYLSLFIDFYFLSPLKRDLDGGLKITQDAICEALDINDNRVVDIHLVKRIDPSRPRIQVQLEPISEEDWQFDEEFVYVAAPRA